jgi:hypothetical protein
MVTKNKASKTSRIEAHTLTERGKSIQAMLNALETEDGLTPWEIGFVHDQMDWFYRLRDLTPRQFETLEKIYRKFN